MKDLFTSLLGFKWRGLNFPCASFEVDLSQDHADHKWPDRDGAHIEGTGRNPLVFTAKAVFRNGVKRAQNEEFVQGVLYPFVYRDFLAACADRTTGILQHPELGEQTVKCKSAKTHWDANKRDGVDVDVVWVETTLVDEALTDPSPAAESAAAAKELDAALAAVTQPNRTGALPFPFVIDNGILRPPPGLPPASFSQLMNGITSVFDQASLFQKQLAGRIDEVAFRLNVLSDAVSKAARVSDWPVFAAIERLKASLHDLKTKLLVATKPISVYIVPKDATLSAICAFLGTSVSDVLQLNTGLFIAPVVTRGTALRYYTNVNDRSR